jgi:hypothetical protein
MEIKAYRAQDDAPFWILVPNCCARGARGECPDSAPSRRKGLSESSGAADASLANSQKAPLKTHSRFRPLKKIVRREFRVVQKSSRPCENSVGVIEKTTERAGRRLSRADDVV